MISTALEPWSIDLHQQKKKKEDTHAQTFYRSLENYLKSFKNTTLQGLAHSSEKLKVKSF